MPQGPFDKLFDQPYLICDEQDQGEKTKAICVFTGVQVNEEFVIGPIKLRPRTPEDKFPDRTRFDFQHSVLELNYIDTKTGLSMYLEPMLVQQAAFKAIQLLVSSWSGISLIYHFDEHNHQVGGASGSTRFQTADTEAAGILEATDKKKELFKRLFRASFGDLKHAIDRFSRACTEIKGESILDFVISLEATLGYKLDTEIGHRLSSRGAFLLGADPSKRERYYSIFKTLYNIRSRIAHGGAVTAKVPEPFVEAITTLGYWTGSWSKEVNAFKVRHIADVARQVSRQVLIEFVKSPELLNENNLLKLELGIKLDRRQHNTTQ
jgi:hypothetical protein